jgi:hypothetical protein
MANGTNLSQKHSDARTRRKKKRFAELSRKKQRVAILGKGTGSVPTSQPMLLENLSVRMLKG